MRECECTVPAVIQIVLVRAFDLVQQLANRPLVLTQSHPHSPAVGLLLAVWRGLTLEPRRRCGEGLLVQAWAVDWDEEVNPTVKTGSHAFVWHGFSIADARYRTKLWSIVRVVRKFKTRMLNLSTSCCLTKFVWRLECLHKLGGRVFMAALALVLLAKVGHCYVELLDPVLEVETDWTDTICRFRFLDLHACDCACVHLCVHVATGGGTGHHLHSHRCSSESASDPDSPCVDDGPGASRAPRSPAPSLRYPPLSHGEYVAVCVCVCVCVSRSEHVPVHVCICNPLPAVHLDPLPAPPPPTHAYHAFCCLDLARSAELHLLFLPSFLLRPVLVCMCKRVCVRGCARACLCTSGAG